MRMGVYKENWRNKQTLFGEIEGDWGKGQEVYIWGSAVMEQMECITLSYDRNDLWNDLTVPA